MISETDRKKINKILRKIKYLQNEHTQLMHTDTDYDGQCLRSQK